MIRKAAAAAVNAAKRQAVASPAARAAMSSSATVKLKPLSESVIGDVIQSNREWADSMLAEDPEYFKRMAETPQRPEILFIGCADSRVPANSILGGAPPGKVFVMRNIANQVNASDMGAMSLLEFAVEHLQVPKIFVVGHYGCGGVQAAMAANDPAKDSGGCLENWLRGIRDVQRLNHQELSAIEDPKERERRLVELNVKESCLNVLKTGVVQRARHKSPERKPKIHGLVYDIADGHLVELDIDFKHYGQKYDDVYRLY